MSNWVSHKCVSPPPISHGGEYLSVLFYTFIFALLPDLHGQIFPVIYMIFYITFHFFYCSTMLLIALFRMGESDYLDDNLNEESILRKRKMIFFFYFLIPILGYVSKILFCHVFPLKRSFRWIFFSLHGDISLNESLLPPVLSFSLSGIINTHEVCSLTDGRRPVSYESWLKLYVLLLINFQY